MDEEVYSLVITFRDVIENAPQEFKERVARLTPKQLEVFINDNAKSMGSGFEWGLGVSEVMSTVIDNMEFKGSAKDRGIIGVRILKGEIIFPELVDFTKYSLGAVRLELNGRNFILDTEWSHLFDEGGFTRVDLDFDLDLDESDFEDGLWNLTKEDLASPELIATLYIGEDDYPIEPESMSLFVEIDGERKTISLTNECNTI